MNVGTLEQRKKTLIVTPVRRLVPLVPSCAQARESAFRSSRPCVRGDNENKSRVSIQAKYTSKGRVQYDWACGSMLKSNSICMCLPLFSVPNVVNSLSWRDGCRQSLSCISGCGLTGHFNVPCSQVVIRESILNSTGCQHLLAEVVLVVADRSGPRLDGLVLAHQNLLGNTVEQSEDELVGFGKADMGMEVL